MVLLQKKWVSGNHQKIIVTIYWIPTAGNIYLFAIEWHRISSATTILKGKPHQQGYRSVVIVITRTNIRQSILHGVQLPSRPLMRANQKTCTYNDLTPHFTSQALYDAFLNQERENFT